MKRFTNSITAHTLQVVVLGLLIVFPLGCTKKEPKELKIGAILPLTGQMASHGEDAKKAIDLATDVKNKRGGLKGLKILTIYEDDNMQPKDGVSAFNKLVIVDRVQAVIGGFGSSVALAIAPIAQQKKVVFVSPTASHPKLPLIGNYIFRIWSSDIFEGEKMAQEAHTALKLRNIAILFVNNDFGRGMSDIFSAQFRSFGGKVVLKDSYEQGDTDFRAQLHRIKDTTAEAVYLPGYYQEVAKILKQAKELGVNLQFLSTTPVENPELLRLAGNSAEGLIYTRPSFNPKNPDENYMAFVALFKSKYGVEPGVAAAYSYDAANIIFACIEKGGITSREIRDAMENLRNYRGATGRISFDEVGDVVRDFDLFTIEKGKFVRYQ